MVSFGGVHHWRGPINYFFGLIEFFDFPYWLAGRLLPLPAVQLCNSCVHSQLILEGKLFPGSRQIGWHEVFVQPTSLAWRGHGLGFAPESPGIPVYKYATIIRTSKSQEQFSLVSFQT